MSMKQRFKRHLFWCPKCDRNHISNGEKCSVCGYKSPYKFSRNADKREHFKYERNAE